MKHILSLLTIALLGAAATASAVDTTLANNYYYDYYDTVSVSPTVPVHEEIPNTWTPTYTTDTVTYKDFQIVRISHGASSAAAAPLNQSDHYKINITGKNVDLYLTDFIDDTGNPYNENAIVNKGVTEYGYRFVDTDGNPVGDVVPIDVPAKPDVIDSVTFNEGQSTEYTVTRYKYKLGTFHTGQVIELYMKDKANGTAFSYSNHNNEVGKDAAQGGYGDGEKIVENTDKLMLLYQGGDAYTAAANKAMPLAALVPSLDRTVYFGIYAQAVGSPLPGGLPIAIVAGLFGLGFWFVRRRKAVAA